MEAAKAEVRKIVETKRIKEHGEAFKARQVKAEAAAKRKNKEQRVVDGKAAVGEAAGDASLAAKKAVEEEAARVRQAEIEVEAKAITRKAEEVEEATRSMQVPVHESSRQAQEAEAQRLERGMQEAAAAKKAALALDEAAKASERVQAGAEEVAPGREVEPSSSVGGEGCDELSRLKRSMEAEIASNKKKEEVGRLSSSGGRTPRSPEAQGGKVSREEHPVAEPDEARLLLVAGKGKEEPAKEEPTHHQQMSGKSSSRAKEAKATAAARARTARTARTCQHPPWLRPCHRSPRGESAAEAKISGRIERWRKALSLLLPRGWRPRRAPPHRLCLVFPKNRNSKR